jgi:hypothetical protein
MGQWRYSFTFTNPGTDGGVWSPSRPCRFTPGERWVGGWVGPRVGLNSTGREKSCIYGNTYTIVLYSMDPKLVKEKARRMWRESWDTKCILLYNRCFRKSVVSRRVSKFWILHDATWNPWLPGMVHVFKQTSFIICSIIGNPVRQLIQSCNPN